ncbi:MAG: helix-hairpin-helix domain-containing protein, partial [Acidobacteriota bacterium]|nr:helix-hairpin-helix domain-containing protein [Acidobacteriota bacterium]
MARLPAVEAQREPMCETFDMDNAEIAAVFKKMALLLQIQGANPFRVRAYENAAHTVDDATEAMATLVERGDDLTALDGIGKEMAA